MKTSVTRTALDHAVVRTFTWAEVKKKLGVYRQQSDLDLPGQTWRLVTTGRPGDSLVTLFVSDSGVVENAHEDCYSRRTFVLCTDSLTVRFEN